jgi:formylglycine-generating enzyme required for sulfatase activity
VLPVVLLLVVALAVGLYFAMGRTTKPVVIVEHPLPKILSMPAGDMVLVPEGTFKFGENQEPISLPAFYIDKTEVTNRAYADFCAAANYQLPKDFPPNQPEYPVVNVSFVDAQRFAAWAAKKLPTGHQWEKAARGTEGWMFPWGNDKDPAKANVYPKENIDPNVPPMPVRPATDFALGASPFGALNMVGNVWELVDQEGVASAVALKRFATRMQPAPTADDRWYVIRGGSNREPLVDDLIWDSSTVPAKWKYENIGFRCVKDPPKDGGK